MTNKEIIKEIEIYGKSFKGGKELIKYLKGETITQRQAIMAKCYDCNGYYPDSVKECEVLRCPLLLYNPYNTKRVKKVMSNENKAKAAERFAKIRKNKKS